MKEMNWFRTFTAIVIGAVALCACDKTEENPADPIPSPSELKPETIMVNGSSFQSSTTLIKAKLGEKNIRIAVTPSSGVKAENSFGGSSVIEVEVAPELIGKELDLVTEKGVHAIAVSWSEPSISINKTNNNQDENLAMCKCLVTEANGGYELFLIFKTKGGDKFCVRATASREENPGTQEDETIVIDDKSFPIKSKIATDFEGGIYVAVSTAEGKETLEQIAEDSWMGVYVNPSLLDKEFDLYAESTNFTVSVYMEGMELDVANGWTDMITEGKCLVKKIEDGAKYEASVSLKTIDGTTISMHATAAYTPGEQGDGSLFCYSADGAEDPCRAAFYEVDGDMHNLYFTSADVSYFEDMTEQAFYFAWVGIDKKALTGSPVSFTSTSSDVNVYIYNNLEKDEYGDATYQMVDNGTITATNNGEGNYTVSLDCSFQDGSTLRVEYDGEFKSVDVSAEDEYTNTFTYNEDTYAIQSVYIEKNSDTKWTVYISDTDAKSFEECKNSNPVILEIPPLTEENTIFGFSQHEDVMSISYKERKWLPGEDTGTVEGYIADSELTIRFETYDGLSGQYRGQFNFAQ